MHRCLASLALLALLAAVRPLAGQSTVTAIRNLAFGAVIRGVPSTVLPSDPIKSGRFYVRHIINRQVQVRFTLPTRLNRVAGGTNMPITFTLTSSADFFVNIGGRVSPAANQATGAYSGTITLTCTFF